MTGVQTCALPISRLDLEPWQRLADQNFQGDIERLIRYHLESSDPQFHAEGGIIRSLVTTVQQLQSAAEQLQGSLFRQVSYLALHADPALARATWHDWVPTFALSADGIAFALLFAILVWLAFHSLWRLLALLGTARRRGPQSRLSRV